MSILEDVLSGKKPLNYKPSQQELREDLKKYFGPKAWGSFPRKKKKRLVKKARHTDLPCFGTFEVWISSKQGKERINEACRGMEEAFRRMDEEIERLRESMWVDPREWGKPMTF